MSVRPLTETEPVHQGKALACMARYISVAHEGLDARCVDRDGLKVRISYLGVPRHADRHQMEALMTAVIRICRQLTGLHVRPLRVGLAHPRVISSAEIDAFFGVAVDFGAEADEIAFSAARCERRSLSQRGAEEITRGCAGRHQDPRAATAC